MLMIPEGHSERRRHAHTECVLAARKAGRLPTKGEWQQTQPRRESALRRALARLAGRGERGGARPD
jgi:hypothetical protein